MLSPAALRLVLTATWAAWIWLELVAVLGPTVLDQVRGRGRPQDARSAGLLLVCAAAALVAAVRLARIPFGALPGSPVALMAGGIVVVWLGLALQVWAIQHLGGLFRSVVVVPRDHRLVTTGPYRRLRHPSYTGALLAAAGFGVALGRWTSLIVLVAGFGAALAYRGVVEERALCREFGPAFEEYRSRSWRLIPPVY